MDTLAAPIDTTSRRLDALLADYAASHRHPGSAWLEAVALPAVMVGLVGLLFGLHSWAAYAFVGASLVYYALLQSPLLLAIMSAWTVLVIGLASAMGARPVLMSLALLAGGWVVRLIGERLEGRRPAFFADLQTLWLGQLFLATLALRKLGVRW